jgi:hypothetical protein
MDVCRPFHEPPEATQCKDVYTNKIKHETARGFGQSRLFFRGKRDFVSHVVSKRSQVAVAMQRFSPLFLATAAVRTHSNRAVKKIQGRPKFLRKFDADFVAPSAPGPLKYVFIVVSSPVGAVLVSTWVA